MGLQRSASIALLTVLAFGQVVAQTGLIPLNDLGNSKYMGFPGGLYPNGQNTPPFSHRQAALAMAAQIVPRDSAGQPDPGGWIAMVATGMSNATHEFAVFERDQDLNVDRNARVVLVDSALGGQSAAVIAQPSATYWTTVEQRLSSMGLSAEQVQVAWVKEANANPPVNFPVHAQELRDDLESIANILHTRFPNLKLCYLSGRSYGGYATTPLNPEPQAYESSFPVKWLIEDQVNGDPGLSYGQLPGPAQAPLLLWGPYLWADGTNPRSDGLLWLSSDFEEDGTHPSPAGEQKVADLLSEFFEIDISARAWWPRQDDSVLVSADAIHDAHVDGSHPDSNFGATTQLVSRGGAPPSFVFLGFDSGVNGPIATLAKLSLRVVNGGGGAVRVVNDNAWNESTITFSNAPQPGALVAEMPISSRDGTIGADVTGVVQTDDDGLVSFAMNAPGTSELVYHSEEGGQPPRLVLSVPCASSPDGDGDATGDICDCAPGDPTLIRVPSEIQGLRWVSSTELAWDSDATNSGTATRYDVMSGTLQDVSFYGTEPQDVCVGDDLAALVAPDTSPSLSPGEGRFFLVRGDNPCGAGRYQTAFDGRDRTSTTCP